MATTTTNLRLNKAEDDDNANTAVKTLFNQNWDTLDNLPAVRVRHGSNQSIATGTATGLSFDTEDFDSDSMHDNGTNNDRLTATTAGVYAIYANLQWGATVSTLVQVEIQFNGAATVAQHQILGTDYREMNIYTTYQFSAADYVTVRVRQDSGGSVDINSNSFRSPVFGMTRIA